MHFEPNSYPFSVEPLPISLLLQPGPTPWPILAPPLPYRLSLVPEHWVSHELGRTCCEVEFKGETEHSIHVLQEIQAAANLNSDLSGHGQKLISIYWPLSTCSGVQKMCASSCWKRLTLVRPDRAPDNSLRWRTPKSAIRSGSSRHDRGRWSNIKLATKCST